MTDELSADHQEEGQDVRPEVEAFARAILETPEYRAFVAARDAVQADREASALWHQYEHEQEELAGQVGLNAAAFGDMRALYDRVRSNPTLSAYQAAERALATLLNQTNDRISERIGRQFACGHRGGCACHGGHHHGGCC
jgi:cell fate (sporulation/competence/biofilm development) regulator YlbF (YheA/YmcA/DUF963 family)